MELIPVVFVIFLVAVLLAWISKINIAFLFAPSIFFIALWEFFFGLSGSLGLGMEALVLFVGALTLILLFRSVQFRASILKSLYLPSTIAFFLLATISFLKSKDWVLYNWDEFTHWGHVVRIMYEYGALGPSTPTDYYSEDYPPGISLFQYFVIDFSSDWSEGMLFWSIHLIAISVIVSVLAKCSYKNFSEIVLKLFVALVASFAFFNYFDNVYADPSLAITFGFLIVIAINASSLGGRWAIIFAASAAFLTLIKPIGIYFALSAILVNIVATLFTLKLKSIKEVIFLFLPALSSIAAVGAAWMAWGYYRSSLITSNYSPLGSVPRAFSSSGREEFVSGVISSFTNNLFQIGLNPISWSNMPASKWTIVCIVFFAIWMYLNGKGRTLRNSAIGMTLLTLSAGYLAVVLNAYLTGFGASAEQLPSFSRYVATWYQGVFFAIVLLILSEFDLVQDADSNSVNHENFKYPNKKQIGILLITFMALTTLSSIGNYVNLVRSPQFRGSELREPFAPIIKAIKAAGISEGSKVYIITQHKTGFEYFVLRYEMIGAQFGQVPFSIGSPYNDIDDHWTEPSMDAAKWSDTLRDFDFVVLYITTESFNREFSSLFKGGVVEPNTVYRVVKSSDKVSLSKVS